MADSHTRISTNSHELFIVSGGLFVVDGDFYYAVFFVFEDAVGFLDAAEGEAVGDEWGGVDFALLDEAKHFLAVAAVNAASLEGEVLAIHVGQGEHLWLVVEGYDGDDGVGACALPSQAERVLGSSHFQHAVGSAMVAVISYKLLALVGSGEHHLRIMLLYEAAALLRRFADDDALGLFQHGAEQGADARRSGSDDEHRVFLRYLAYACCPESRCQHVAHEQCLLVAYAVGNAVEPLRSQRHTHVLGLSAVDATTESPASVRRRAVVDVAVLAEEAFAAECLHVHCDAVARSYSLYVLTDLFHHAYHLVSYGDAGHSPWHAAVLDVEVACADAAQCDADDGVSRFLQHGLRLVGHGKLAFLNVCICFHSCMLITLQKYAYFLNRQTKPNDILCSFLAIFDAFSYICNIDENI